MFTGVIMRISTLLLIFSIFTNTMLSVKSMESHDDEDDSNATWISLKDLRPTLSMIANQSKEEEPSLQKELIPSGPEAKREVTTKKSTPIKLLPDHLNALSEADKNKAAGTTNRNEWIHRLEKIWEDKVNSSSLPFAIWKYLPKDIQQEICSHLKDDLPIIQDIKRVVFHNKPCSVLIETKNPPKELLIHNDRIITSEYNIDFFYSSLYQINYRRAKTNLIRIYELKTGKYLKELKGHANSITTIIATDNKIISGDLDGIIKIWDIVSGKCLHTLTGHQNAIISLNIYTNDLAFFELVSQSQDKTVKFWDMEKGKQTLSTDHHQILTIRYNIIISQINNNICVEGYKDKIIILKGHSATINEAILKDDAFITVLITCDNDGTIKIWDLNEEILLKDLHSNYTLQGIALWKNKLVGLANNNKVQGAVLLQIFDLDTKEKETTLNSALADLELQDLKISMHNQQSTKIIIHNNKIYLACNIIQLNTLQSDNGFIRVWDLEMQSKIKQFFLTKINFLETKLIRESNNDRLTALSFRIFLFLAKKLKTTFDKDIVNLVIGKLLFPESDRSLDTYHRTLFTKGFLLFITFLEKFELS